MKRAWTLPRLAVALGVVLLLVGLTPGTALAVTVTVAAPSEGAVLSGTVLVNVAASSPVRFDITLDGASLASIACCTTGGLAGWATRVDDNGPHVLRVTATDSSGAMATAARSVYVNNPGPGPLRLVSARDHLDVAMTVSHDVYADVNRLYLGGFQGGSVTGRLYVLARDRAADFPVLEALDFPSPVMGVRGDDSYLYVTEGFSVHVYRKTRPLSLLTSFTMSSSGGGPRGLAIVGDRLYVAVGQGKVNADDRHLYMTVVNPGEDVVMEVFRDTWTIGRVYGTSAQPGVLTVFDRLTGDLVASVPASTDGSGLPVVHPSDIYVDNGVLVVSYGPQNQGIGLYDPATITPIAGTTGLQSSTAGANATTRRNNILLSGHESGMVFAWDLTANPERDVTVVDLRRLTGHNGIEDIEIRTLWTDAFDALIFAGSSFGNATSRGPTLPAFFVLELKDPPPAVTITAATSVIGERAGATDAFVISRAGSTAGDLTVNYSVGGTATPGDDYDALSGSATIPDGGTSTTIRVSPKTDNITETDETIVITLTPAAPYYVGTPNSGTVTIRDGAPAGSCPTGQFLAEYFSNIAMTAPATRTACEAAVNYAWGSGGPTGLPVDNFSARWTGRFNFIAGSVAFTARADDGIRVFLDGVAIIDQFHDQPATTYTATRTVTGGEHEVKVEYYERGGDALAQVTWTGATASPPALRALTPNSATAGGPTFTLTVDGANFATGATVLWNGASRATTFVSTTRLAAAIAAADIAAAGPVPVSVKSPDGQTSNTLTFTVNPAGSSCSTGAFFAQYFNNTTLTPPVTRTACEPAVNNDWGAGGPAGLPVDNFSARWTGLFNFAAGTVTFTAKADDGMRVFLDGVAIIDQWHDQPPTTYTAAVTPTAGMHEVKIEYYERGGDAVAQVSWTGAAPPAPTVTTLTPSSATAGNPAFTLTADGTNFVAGATVLWNGATRATTFVSGTRVTASIPASDIAAAASVPVSVRNPDAQTSSTRPFTVTAGGGCQPGQFFAEYFANIALTPPAARTGCEPSVSYDYGAGGPSGLPVDNFSARWTGILAFVGGAVTFTARADDGVRLFLDGVVIIDQWHDAPATTYTATRTVSAGNHEVKVEYYERGGDAVIQVSWTGAPPPAPTVTTLTPNSAAAGTPAFTLTADGANFVSGATVLWNGAARTTTFVGDTRLTASIPASDVAAAASVQVSVRNPDGQTSGMQTFTINGGGGGDTIKVFITAPARGATVRGAVWFTIWMENAAAGSRTVTLTVNGATITSTTTTSNGPISLPWTTTAADNGSRTATIMVRDSANATGRASVTVTVAN